MVLSLFHFLLFAFSQIATPGPANMIMLSTGAKYGFRNALPFVSGVIWKTNNNLADWFWVDAPQIKTILIFLFF